METHHYRKLGLMSVIGFITMYATMFLNVDDSAHVMVSLTRTYMAALMVAPMTITMLLLMWPMFKRRGLNAAILGTSVAVFFASLALLRTQTPVTDIQYMRAMIPHHSSAILTSRRATLRDPETRRLAGEIIESQEREIAQMKRLITRLKAEQNP